MCHMTRHHHHHHHHYCDYSYWHLLLPRRHKQPGPRARDDDSQLTSHQALLQVLQLLERQQLLDLVGQHGLLHDEALWRAQHCYLLGLRLAPRAVHHQAAAAAGEVDRRADGPEEQGEEEEEEEEDWRRRRRPCVCLRGEGCMHAWV